MKTNHSTNTSMRKHSFFCAALMLLLLTIAAKTTAQELDATSNPSSYLKLGFGYGLPSGSQMMGTNSTYTMSSSSSTSKEEGIYGSLGSGLSFNVAYTHMYSKNIGLDLNLQYLHGKEYKSDHAYTFNGTTNTSTSSFHSRGVLLSPSILITTGENSVKPYVQMGIVMGKVNATYESGNPISTSVSTFKGGFSFGFKGAFGIDAVISKKTIFFTELAFTSMSYYPKSVTMNETVNGNSSERTIEFVKEITYSSGGNQGKELRDSMAMGSIALNIGLKFRLAGKNI